MCVCVCVYILESVGAWVYMHANLTVLLNVTPMGVAVGREFYSHSRNQSPRGSKLGVRMNILK